MVIELKEALRSGMKISRSCFSGTWGMSTPAHFCVSRVKAGPIQRDPVDGVYFYERRHDRNLQMHLGQSPGGLTKEIIL